MAQTYPPGPKSTVPLGNIRLLQKERLNFLTTNREKYGDIVHFQLGKRHFYQLNDPDSIQYVLVKHPEMVNKSPALKNTTRQTIGQGMLTSDGEFHKRQRRLVQPAFHSKRIAAYADIMVNYTRDMLDEWHGDDEREISHEMMKLTMRIVSKTLFDADVSEDADSIGGAITIGIQSAAERITQPIHLPDWMPTRKNRQRRHSAQIIEKAVMGMIDERRALGEDKGDLLSMLLLAVDEADGGQMTNRQVRDEAMTLFIAGHETTANALAWALYLLSQNPDADAKLYEELHSVLGGRTPTMAVLPKLVYTDMVVKETMRMYPPAFAITREVAAAFELNGYAIPKGSILLMSQYVMHHDPRYFPEPDRFQPERFAPEYEDHLPKYAYFPFGGGPRICIGNQFAQMEAVLVLATIMESFHMSLMPGQTIVPSPLITLRPKYGLQMTLTAREPAVSPEKVI
ncbi:MAG: cytochrome P450 [Chloroflexota bacterium]